MKNTKPFLLLLTLTLSCVSQPHYLLNYPHLLQEKRNQQYEYKKCYQLYRSRWKRRQCIRNRLKELENIYKAPIYVEEVQSFRIDEDFQYVHYKICFSNVCKTYAKKEYRPSLWGVIKRNIIISLIGIASGYYIK